MCLTLPRGWWAVTALKEFSCYVETMTNRYGRCDRKEVHVCGCGHGSGKISQSAGPAGYLKESRIRGKRHLCACIWAHTYMCSCVHVNKDCFGGGKIVSMNLEMSMVVACPERSEWFNLRVWFRRVSWMQNCQPGLTWWVGSQPAKQRGWGGQDSVNRDHSFSKGPETPSPGAFRWTDQLSQTRR